jgi:putative hydrolase of the HAD superfamily
METGLSRLVSRRRAVIFDLFHTLVEVQPEGATGRTTADILGVDSAEWRSVLWEDTHDRLVGRDRDPHSIVRTIAHRLDPTISDDLIREAVASRLRRFARCLSEVPGSSMRALERLKQSGKRIGLISNADVTEVVAWPESPLAPFFDSTIFSCDVGAKKPDAEIYLRSLRELGVRPDEGVFVGDGGSNELKGAREVGLTTVMMAGMVKRLFPELLDERRSDADYVIDDVQELLG